MKEFYHTDFHKLFQEEYRASGIHAQKCSQEEWDALVDNTIAKVKAMHEAGEIDASPIIDNL